MALLTIFNKRSSKETNSTSKGVQLKNVKYSPKVILAWAKAIEGNVKINTWLLKNGFVELSVSVSAICLKDDARSWLMSNGYAHLFAMINASEGNKKAQIWLQKNNMMTFYHIAMAVEGEKTSWAWIGQNCGLEVFILATSIKKIKDQIEENHNDPHFYGKDL
ncbi:MAG: hypothetical protein P8I93_03925 [Crocinitomicaceae bacterium]|nr:hypothetical protein [Crocinitomicaceae bacterium]